MQITAAYPILSSRSRQQASAANSEAFSALPTDSVTLSSSSKTASPTKKFLLGAAIGGALGAAACLAVQGAFTPFGAIVALSTACVGGVLGRDGKNADFSEWNERFQRDPLGTGFPYP